MSLSKSDEESPSPGRRARGRKPPTVDDEEEGDVMVPEADGYRSDVEVNEDELEGIQEIVHRRGYEVKQAKIYHTKKCDVCTWEVPKAGDFFVQCFSREICLQSYFNKQVTPEDGECDIPIKYFLQCFKNENAEHGWT